MTWLCNSWKKFVLRVSFIKWLAHRAINEPSRALRCPAKYKSAWARIELCKLGSDSARNFISQLKLGLPSSVLAWMTSCYWEGLRVLLGEDSLCTTSSVFWCVTYVKESIEELFTLDLSRIKNVRLLSHRNLQKQVRAISYRHQPSPTEYWKGK